MIICDECETVAHCTKHGCIPKQPLGCVNHNCAKCKARPAPVQAPVRWTDEEYREISDQVISTLVEYGVELRAADCQMQILREELAESRREVAQLKAQRQWVGLTEQERNDIEDYCEMIIGKPTFDAIEAKLKEKNT